MCVRTSVFISLALEYVVKILFPKLLFFFFPFPPFRCGYAIYIESMGPWTQ